MGHLHHIREFSRKALIYNNFNFLQKTISKRVLENVSSKSSCKKIVDFGCGTGVIFSRIKWRYDLFIGIDASSNMCKMHPRSDKCLIFNLNFDDSEAYDYLSMYNLDLAISSSSLQWSMDIKNTLINISRLFKRISFSIFIYGTFEKLYDMVSVKSFLPTSQELLFTLDKLYKINYEIIDYKIYFPDNLSKFRYIKNSGVARGNRLLSYPKTKKLIKDYPLDYLEFKVLFVWA